MKQARFIWRGFFLLLMTWMVGEIGEVSAASNPEKSLIEWVQEDIQKKIESAGPSPQILCQGELICESTALPRFYGQRSFRPAWINERGDLPQADFLLQAIHGADQEGLRAEDYRYSKLLHLVGEVRQQKIRQIPLSPEKLADLDFLLTDTFLVYAAHLLEGRVNPETIQAEWHARGRITDLAEILEKALDSRKIETSLKNLLPLNPGYNRLRQCLRDYRQTAQMGGWPPVPDGPRMRKGDFSSRVESLRKRLTLSGDLDPEKDSRGNSFDENVDQAVRRFQNRHGLEADGVVGPATLGKLHISVEERIQQVRVNLERWRWLPRDLGERYIRVNIANYGLEVVEKEDPILTMRAVVGKRYQRTPVFSALMTYMVLRPYWNVPPNIAKKEILPLVQKDPGYLFKNQMKVFQGWSADRKEINPRTVDWATIAPENFPYNFRQEPGNLNALGRIKFMLPNKFNVYLHDTPARNLFQRTVREFSHGCIRIEKPIELALYLLKESSAWSEERLLQEIDKSTDRIVRIPKPIPVHVLYWTAWVDEDGTVQLRDDIYRRDEPLKKALEQKAPVL
jgi:murein L,D-transpeptidase YcbB/YkuD